MEQISFHLSADHSGAQPEEGALSETNRSEEATWLQEDEQRREHSSFRGIWVGIVSAVVTFALVFMVPHWFGWWNGESIRSTTQGNAPVPAIASSLDRNTPSSALIPKTRPTARLSGPEVAVSASGGRGVASAEPPTSASSTPVPVSSAGSYWVQIAVFKDATQAVRLATRMRREGYPAEVRRRDSTANPWTVRLGKYPTRERAEAVRAALEKKGFRGFLL
jgi:cell division septation protein DedD